MPPPILVTEQAPEPMNEGVRLGTLLPGAEVRVVTVNGSGPISRRLKEMGVVPGVSVRIVKTAPMGDPMEIRLLGYSLAVRRSEADLIDVVPLST